MIKRRSLKLGLCMAMLCMWTCLPSVFAAPARPGVITVTQRDGTQLQIRIYGDEYYNYTMTTDGYTLVGGADGDYYFAKLNGKGQLVSTGIKAKPLSKLSAAERQAVAASKGVLPVQTQSQKVMAASRNISRAATDKNGAPALMASSRFKAEGEKEFLVLLVQFKDIPFKVENPKEAFDQMKDGVVILNFARDLLVNDDDMKAALESGKVRRYVTDFPNPAVVKMPNVIATPHLGASTAESEDNCAVMAVHELREFLENGNIINSVNYPNCDAGVCNTEGRITVAHKNIPTMLTQFTNVFAEEGINIAHMTNKSRGDYSYCVFDIDAASSKALEDKLNAIDGVLKVRIIK